MLASEEQPIPTSQANHVRIVQTQISEELVDIWFFLDQTNVQHVPNRFVTWLDYTMFDVFTLSAEKATKMKNVKFRG